MPVFVEDPPGSGLYVPAGLTELEPGLFTANTNGTAVFWRDIVFARAAEGTGYALRDLKGWEELPGYTTQKTPVSGGHGTLLAPIQFDERVVTVTGWCYSVTARDGLLAAFQRSCAPSIGGAQAEPLGVFHAGRSLTAYGRVVNYSAIPEAGWALGRFAWAVQFLCNDPLRYGEPVNLSSPFPQPGAGLALPAALPAAFPDAVPGGGFTVNNDGTTLTPATYTVTGPVSWPGVMVTAAGVQRRVIYQMNIASGDSLVISTQDGGAGLLNGEYRVPYGGSNLTSDMVLWPGENIVQGLGTASTGDPLPAISLSYRPAYL